MQGLKMRTHNAVVVGSYPAMFTITTQSVRKETGNHLTKMQFLGKKLRALSLPPADLLVVEKAT